MSLSKFFPKSLIFSDLNFESTDKILEKLLLFRSTTDCLICNIPKFTINNSLIEFDENSLVCFKTQYPKVPGCCLPAGYFDFLYTYPDLISMKNCIIDNNGNLLLFLKPEFKSNKCEIFIHTSIIFNQNNHKLSIYDELNMFLKLNFNIEFTFIVFNKDITVFSSPKLPVIYNIKKYIKKLITTE